jgi:hypothetical protein
MKLFFTFLFVAISTFSVFAQTTAQISAGAGYKKQAFYSLKNDAVQSNDNTAWDIAFSVYGNQDAAVFVNEASGTSAGMTLPAIELYAAPTNVFADAIKATDVQNRLYNDELSWSSGGFNSEKDVKNPFDYGWGIYNTGNNLVEGKKVFVLKFRDAKFRKLEIQNLTATKYTFRHANLDGTDEKAVTLDKKDFAGKTLAYYSFTTAKAVDIEPTGFDFMFTRYSSLLTQGPTTTQYVVLGILTGKGIKVAKASGIDPVKVKATDYANSYKNNIDEIGHDWKSFNLNINKWEFPTDRAYFVKQLDGTVWKITFIDFEGSATGTATFDKMNLGKISSINDISSEISFKVYPTVVQDQVNVVFDTPNSENIEIAIVDMNGREVASQKVTTSAGFQVENIDVSNLLSGTYVVKLSTSKGIATSKIIK